MDRSQKRNENRTLLQKAFTQKNDFIQGYPYNSFSFCFPHTITVEPGAVCPLPCPFCPQTDENFDLSREFMKMEEYKKIIDYFRDYIDHVNLFNWGEPLLNPQITEMIAYTSMRTITTTIHTNLNFLSASLAEKLIKSGLTELSISLDGVSEGSYQKYRQNGSFRTAWENLKMLLAKKEELKASTPHVVWQFLVFRHNEHEMRRARREARSLGIPIKFSFAIAKGEFESTLPEFNNEDLKEKFVHHYDPPCDQLWKGPIIHSNGDIFPCCMLFQKQYAAGNIFRQDFKSIWNNDLYRQMRCVVAGKNAPGEHLFCSRCIFSPYS